jgi:AraC-like DNA-binding protein
MNETRNLKTSGPWCWQSKAALRLVRDAHDATNDVTTALAVYVALTECASNEGKETFTAAHAWINRLSGVSVRTIQKHLKTFAEIGLIAIDVPRLRAPSRFTLLPVRQSLPDDTQPVPSVRQRTFSAPLPTVEERQKNSEEPLPGFAGAGETPRKQRKPDPIFDAIAEAFGYFGTGHAIAKANASLVAKTAKEIRIVAPDVTAEERDLIRKNVFTVRSFKSGPEWLREIEPLMVKHRPDILLADPLFAYAGVDVAKDQPGLSAFLREMVQPFIIKHACGIIFAHHTNKPPSGKEKPNWQAGDYAYAGSGHNELANWPRFVAVLRSLGSRTVFELRIGKRWKRAGICDTNGQPTDRVLIQHSDTGICWKTATDQDLARTVETAGGTARTVAAVDKDEVIVRAFNACAKKGRADIETVAKRCKFSEKTLRRRFKDDRGNARLVRSGDDVLTITNAQVVAVETEVQDDLAA